MHLARLLNRGAAASLLLLIALGVAWEWRLAPLRPGGSTLVLKVLPLLAPLPGILRGRRYTHQWTSLLSLAYLMEGVVRATTDSGASRWLALAEIVFALSLFATTAFYARLSGRGNAGTDS